MLARASVSPSPAIETPSAPEFVAPHEPESAVLGNWRGRLSSQLISLARAQAEENAPRVERIPIRLSAARTGVVAVDGFQPTEEDGGVFTGTLEGYPGSTVVLSYVGQAHAGVVLIPAESRAFNIRGGDDGLIEITELNTRLAPGCGEIPRPPGS